MANFDDVVKYLDLDRASRDTTHNLKPLTLYKSRAIKKINTVYNFELFIFNGFNFWPVKYPQIIAQYNVTAAEDFTILNYSDFIVDNAFIAAFWQNITMVVKYREGNTVTRYSFRQLIYPDGSRVYSLVAVPWPWYFQLPDCQNYQGQVIKKNFCIEMWVLRDISSAFVGFADPSIFDPTYSYRLNFRLVTSMLHNPSTPEETERLIEVPLTHTLEDLFVPFNPGFPLIPVTLPADLSNTAWLDNP